jgi:hypothetical protein
MKVVDVPRREGVTDKQHMIDLQRKGFLTPLQLTHGARLYDELRAKGAKKPLQGTLIALQEGKVKMKVVDKRQIGNLPKLKDMPAGASPKQKLLELRRAGSLSPVETREAAAAIDQGKTIEHALVAAGAERLLETLPAKEKKRAKGKKKAEAKKQPEAEPAPAAPKAEAPEEAAPVEARSKGDGTLSTAADAPLTVAELVEKPVKEVLAAAKKINHGPALLSLLAAEANSKDRKSLKDGLVREIRTRFPDLVAEGAQTDALARVYNGGAWEA